MGKEARALRAESIRTMSHPMYVVPVKKLLDPSFGDQLRSHEELKAEGSLVVYEEATMGAVLFCSHTWLRRAHPDNAKGIKLALLRAVLRRAVDGRLELKPGWQIDLVYGSRAARRFRLRAADLKRDLADGYIFFDYASIPQADREAQGRAIASLVNYVNASAYFMCLAGPWVHEDGSMRDDLAWAGRGWCRMELTANWLSASAKPVILACSTSRIVTLPPGGTIGRQCMIEGRVGHGAFTVDADKLTLGPVLYNLITKRKELARVENDVVGFRMMHVLTDWLLDGCGVILPDPEPFEQWMATMRFKTPTDNVRGSGITPLYYAVMSGRTDLVEALLDRGAPIACTCKKSLPKWGTMMGSPALGVAACYARDGRVIELLLRRGADSRQPISFMGDTALLGGVITGNIETVKALMRHDSTLADDTNKLGCMPFFQVWATGHAHMFNFLRSEYPKQLQATVTNLDVHGLGGFGLCAYAISNGAAGGNLLRTTLDEFREPVERYAPNVKGFFRTVVPVMSMIAAVRPMAKLPEFVFVISHLFRSSAIHFAAYFGVLPALDDLLARGADVHSKASPKGMTPLIFAAIGGHDDVCERLLAKGALVGAKDRHGRTALSYAQKLGRDSVTRLLLAHAGEAEGVRRVVPAPPQL